MDFHNNGELLTLAVQAVAETAPPSWKKCILYLEFMHDAEIGLRNKFTARCFGGINFELRLDAYNLARTSKAFNSLKTIYHDALQNSSAWSGILLTIFSDGQFKCRLYYDKNPLLTGDDNALEQIMSEAVKDLPESQSTLQCNSFVEKHGGLWANAEPTTFELFDETRQLLGVVSHRGKLFVATIHEKSADPQWQLPVWREHRPSSLFNTETEAIQHVRSALSLDASR